MNKQEYDVLLVLLQNQIASQREIAAKTGHALGAVNKSLKALEQDGYVKGLKVTAKAKKLQKEHAPKNAVILAAGFGMRMVPINQETPKALLTINKETLIERQIRQLHEAGIREIHVVVGFMKEQFDYLIDQYGVDLIVNPKYASHNNLSSLALALPYIGNTYIVPCDVWCEQNPFARSELYSWYMVSDLVDDESDVRINRKNELVRVKAAPGNAMIGISYLCGDAAETVKRRIKAFSRDRSYDGCFWEEALYTDDRMIVTAREVQASAVAEINTYEQLREIDEGSDQLKSDALECAAEVFHCDTKEITGIEVLKKGMTNRSFMFDCRGNKYIMRIPGAGTDQLINRRQEAEVYRSIRGKGLCDDPVYINAENGYKITKYLNGVRTCDPENPDDLVKAIAKMREFHGMRISVGHSFDIFGQMEFYERLREGTPSMYRDYEAVKANVLKLRKYIDAQKKERCLTHIDAVPDNFLICRDENGKEQIQLTDWEYAGMQDPHVDIAMWCIYSLYDREQSDRLIDLYFDGMCPAEVRCKIYCYIASCGFLWSNWCEYKAKLGVEFGEYSLRQYRYAKDFFRYAEEMMEGGSV
ncbi:MAG: NTP transferase domain-containing protein [Bacillota bacterium]|nr:NTP transferase domain-containing protein [Bacillota bacterium]